MPRIPDADNLGYSVPRTRTPHFQDRSGLIEAEGAIQLAQTVGAVADRFQEREDQFNYAQAKSTLLQADIEARRALEDDNDWESYEKKYSERMAKARESASKLIRGKRDRSLFEMDAKLDFERGLGEVRTFAKQKEVRWGRSTLDQALEANRAAALNAKDEATRTQIITASKELIQGAVQKRYYEEDEGTNLFQSFRDNYALGFLEMQPAEKRIELLSSKGTVAEYLQPDVRAKLLEAAKNENRQLTVRRESQAQEDAIVEKFGGNWSAALSAARDIEDPEVRDSTVSRIKVRQAEAKQFELETREALGEEALAFINDGGKFADLPLHIKNGLKTSALNSLRAYAEQQAGGGTRRTDPETLIELSMLSTDDPQKFGELDMLGYRDKLSDGDFEEFVDLQRKIRSGSLDGKATGFMTINQVRDERIRDIFGSAAPTSKEKPEVSAARRKFITQYETQLKAFKEQTGKPATADDARKILDEMTAEVTINRSLWFDAEKPAFEVTFDDIPDAEGQQIVAALRKAGKAVTPEAVLDLFIRANRK